MSEEQTQVADKPEVGAGSPAGARWFFSRYAELSITMSPQDKRLSHDDKTVIEIKAHRINFTRRGKPNAFIGRGMLGKDIPEADGTDKNQNRYWGIFHVECPSEKEMERIEKIRGEGGRLTRSEEKKLISMEQIKFLREHEYYRMTTQDNVVEANPLLKELNFDPCCKDQAEHTAVLARKAGGEDRTPDPKAPAEVVGTLPKARVSVPKKTS